MSPFIIETHDLDFAFAPEEKILHGLSLQVLQGSIYGFLGPNGAGKTTTLKLLLGLLKKQQGDISIFGKSFEKNRVDILRNTGSLIESPSLYGHLTAVENLTLLQKIYQCPTKRIQAVLQLVGLPNTGNKTAGQFSLGMKQRLSIAVALLHAPALLILDEPTNGLDPNGMIEIRELLKKLNGESGITIVISSHLLAEIERTANCIGIIHRGRMLFQGTMDELKGKQQQALSIVFETNDEAKTLQIMADNNLTTHNKDGKTVVPSISRERIARVNQQLVSSGVEVYEIRVIKNDLEAIFMDLINN